MKTQYTPGPWELRHERSLGKTDHVIRMGKMACYFNRGIGHTEEEALANARLIASAPQLLEALEALLAHEGSPMQAQHKGRCFSFVIPEQAVASARAAINAAKGEA